MKYENESPDEGSVHDPTQIPLVFALLPFLRRLLLHSVLLSEYLKPAIMKLTTLKMKFKSKVSRERLQVE